MRWTQRLKRVFRIDIGSCERCGGKVKIIATVEDAVVVGGLSRTGGGAHRTFSTSS
jgi:hypothetical protein